MHCCKETQFYEMQACKSRENIYWYMPWYTLITLFTGSRPKFICCCAEDTVLRDAVGASVENPGNRGTLYKVRL